MAKLDNYQQIEEQDAIVLDLGPAQSAGPPDSSGTIVYPMEDVSADHKRLAGRGGVDHGQDGVPIRGGAEDGTGELFLPAIRDTDKACTTRSDV